MSELFCFFAKIMEDGGVDRTVIDCLKHQWGKIADFPPLLAFLVFDL
jgi:hypothetical protein